MLASNVGPTRSQRASLLATFKQVAAKIAGKDFSHVSDSTRLSELPIDSLAMAEIIGRLEEQFGMTPIPDERLADMVNVGDLLDVVEAHVG
jgi:acyl carrier protein